MSRYQIYYVDVSIGKFWNNKSWDDYFTYITLIKSVIQENERRYPGQTHICFTNELPLLINSGGNGYSYGQLELQSNKIQCLEAMMLQDKTISSDVKWPNVLISAPLKTLEPNSIDSIKNEKTPISFLSFMLDYARQCYNNSCGLIRISCDPRLIDNIRLDELTEKEPCYLLFNSGVYFFDEKRHLKELPLKDINPDFSMFPDEQDKKEGATESELDAITSLTGHTDQRIQFHFIDLLGKVCALNSFLKVNNQEIPSGVTLSLHGLSLQSSPPSVFKPLDFSGSGIVKRNPLSILSRTPTNSRIEKKRNCPYIAFEGDAKSSDASCNDVQVVTKADELPITTEPFSSSSAIKMAKKARIESDTAQVRPGLSFPISIHDENQLTLLGKKGHFEYLHDNSSSIPNSPLLIDRVVVLPNQDRNLGVFAEKSIRYNLLLGTYLGNRVPSHSVNQKQFTFEFNDNKYCINASKRRNWTAFVNTAAHASMANIGAFEENGKIVYRSIKKIEKGEQLLCDYGRYYQFEDPNVMRFLKKTDNHLDTIELIERDKALYQTPPQQLTEAIAKYLQVSPAVFFKIPGFDQRTSTQTQEKPNTRSAVQVNFDAPLMACDEQKIPLPQAQQENISALMYACITNNLSLVDYLLINGANPNIQSSIQGYTALHLVINTTLAYENKVDIIKKLLDHGALLNLSDRNKQSIIHLDIKTREYGLFAYFISNKKPDERKRYVKDMMELKDVNHLDPFLYSLECNHGVMSALLAQYITLENVKTYLYDDEDSKLFEQHFNGLSNHEEKTRLMNQLKKMIEDDLKTDRSEQQKTLIRLSMLCKQKSIQNTSATFFHPKEKQPSKADLTAARRETAGHRLTMTEHKAAQSMHYAIFEKIISLKNTPIDMRLNQLSCFIESEVYGQLNDKHKLQALKKTAEWYLDHAQWLEYPYKLKLLTSTEHLPKIYDGECIYLIPLEHSEQGFHYDCLGLNGRRLHGQLNSLSNKSEPPLHQVLSLMKQQGHDVSDSARLNKVGMCLEKSKSYIEIFKMSFNYIDDAIEKDFNEIQETYIGLLDALSPDNTPNSIGSRQI